MKEYLTTRARDAQEERNTNSVGESNTKICCLLYMALRKGRCVKTRNKVTRGNQTKNPDIFLIHPSYNRRLGSGIVPPPGLAFLTSSLRQKGFTCRILDCGLYFDSLRPKLIEKMIKKVQEEITLHKPRIAIGIGPCTTSAVRSISAIADTCKRICPETPLLFGGPLALIPNQDWLFFRVLGADAIVKGDGEYPLSQILLRLREGKSLSGIPGVQCSSNQKLEPYFEENLTLLPHPDWDLFDLKSYKPSIRRDLFVYPFAPVMGSRGCPNRCSFCVSGQLTEYRKRSFEDIADEVKILSDRYQIRSLIFYDDSLFSELKANEDLIKFANLLNEAAPKTVWQIEIRPDVFSILSQETIKCLFKCGCRQLNLGVEKSSANQLKLLNKSYDLELFRKSCDSVAVSCPEMRLTGTFILGGPGETPKSILETIEFSTKLHLLFAHFYPLLLYPGTPLYQLVYGDNERIWYDKIISDPSGSGEILYEDEEIPANELIKLVGHAYCLFYQRKDWKDLAQFHLGSHLGKIETIVKSWEKKRFCLS